MIRFEILTEDPKHVFLDTDKLDPEEIELRTESEDPRSVTPKEDMLLPAMHALETEKLHPPLIWD